MTRKQEAEEYLRHVFEDEDGNPPYKAEILVILQGRRKDGWVARFFAAEQQGYTSPCVSEITIGLANFLGNIDTTRKGQMVIRAKEEIDRHIARLDEKLWKGEARLYPHIL
jgi:hypothetical protein